MRDNEDEARQIYEASEARRCTLQGGAVFISWDAAPPVVKNKYRQIARDLPLDQVLDFVKRYIPLKPN